VNNEVKQTIERLFPTVKKDQMIADQTTFGVGGAVAYYLAVFSTEELIEVLKLIGEHNLPYRLLAGGSNVVFTDHVLPVLLVHLQFRDEVSVTETSLIVSAGVSLATVVTESIKNGLAGLEALSGIPGSVGGAVVGNAGAYGQSISDHLETITIFDGQAVREISKEEAGFAYRTSIFKKELWVVLTVKFNLNQGSAEDLMAKSKEIISQREKKYPPGLKCPGSFFKNVLVSEVSVDSLARIDNSKVIGGKIPAGYLLEAVGACGLKTDNLLVAPYHGNLIINTGRASYEEVRQLADRLRTMVFDKFGITLEEEIRYLA